MGDVIPWLPFMVTDFMSGFLKDDMQVFEWGSGDSTLWLAERVGSVVSVEHDEGWARQLQLPGNVILHLEPPEPPAIRADKAAPDAYYSECLGDVNLRGYASTIDSYGAFDLVLVDGRARPSCLRHAVEHVKPGGCLVLDNSERGYYLERTARLFDGWDRMTVTGHGPRLDYPWQAMVWRRYE